GLAAVAVGEPQGQMPPGEWNGSEKKAALRIVIVVGVCRPFQQIDDILSSPAHGRAIVDQSTAVRPIRLAAREFPMDRRLNRSTQRAPRKKRDYGGRRFLHLCGGLSLRSLRAPVPISSVPVHRTRRGLLLALLCLACIPLPTQAQNNQVRKPNILWL